MTAFSSADSIKSQNDCHRQSATLKGKPQRNNDLSLSGVKIILILC